MSERIDITLHNPPVDRRVIPEEGVNILGKLVFPDRRHIEGTHFDGFRHMFDGEPIDEAQLSLINGRVWVVDINDILKLKQIRKDLLKGLILMVKTDISDPTTQRRRPRSLDESLAKFLVEECEVRAIGIDSMGLGTKETHNIFQRRRRGIAEGFNLEQVACLDLDKADEINAGTFLPGMYTLEAKADGNNAIGKDVIAIQAHLTEKN